MKIHYMSDVHLEFGGFKRPIPDGSVDVVILAGDIGLGLQGIEWAAHHYKETEVVYVLGNHEYYGGRSIGDLAGRMQTFADYLTGDRKNIHVLDRNVVDIDDIRFVGATLWTNYSLFGNQPLTMNTAQWYMNDFNQIKILDEGNERKITPDLILQEHNMSWDFIRHELEGDHKCIVVSHHLPLPLGISDEFKNDPLTPAYASNLYVPLDNLLLWVSGHSHNTRWDEIEGAVFAANPRGYVGHGVNKEFDPDLIVQVVDGKVVKLGG